MSTAPRSGFELSTLFLLLGIVPAIAGEPGPGSDGDVPLPKGVLIRLGSLKFRHGPGLHGLAFHPDGKTLASGGGRTIALWDIQSGRELRRIDMTDAGTLAFTRDGKLIVSNRGVLETQTGKTCCEFPSYAWSAAIAPDGSCVAVVDSASFGGEGNKPSRIQLLDPMTGKQIGRLAANKGTNSELAYSPDNCWLVSSTTEPNALHIWDVKKRSLHATIEHDWGHFAFAQGGKKLVTASMGKLRVFEMPSGKLERVLVYQMDEIWSVAASADGSRIAAALADGIHVWDTGTWKKLRHWTCDASWRPPLALSADGKTLATTRYGEYVPLLMDVASGADAPQGRGHRGTVSGLCFSAESQTLWSVAEDQTARSWDWRTGREIRHQMLGQSAALRIAQDLTPVAAAYPGNEHGVWDLATGKRTALIPVPRWVAAPAIAPSGKLVAWRGDKSVHVWDVVAQKPLHQWKSEEQLEAKLIAGNCALAFSADESKFIYGENQPDNDNSELVVRDLKDGKLRRRVKIPRGIFYVCAAPNGKHWVTVASSRNGSEVRVWDAEWRLAYTQTYEEIGDPCFSADGRLLALPNSISKGLSVIEVATGGEVRRFDGLGWCAAAAAFAPNGRALAVADSKSTILVYDLTGRLKDGQLPERPLTGEELASRWRDLAGADAAKAFDALWALVASPKESISLLVKKLTPVPTAAHERVVALLRDLDSDDFSTRELAVVELAQLRGAADVAVQGILARAPSPEVKRRIEKLLDRWAGEDLQTLRALKVLESIGSASAREVLRALAGGAPSALLTVEASAALSRLEKTKGKTKVRNSVFRSSGLPISHTARQFRR